MTDPDREPVRFAHHGNAFGLLRLVLASAVIFSHAPMLLDGGPRRELFVQLFGSVSIGEVAVDGFFAISGFLISASLLGSSSIGAYLRKRVARIYPAAIVASLVCLLIVAPLGGADLRTVPPLEWLAHAKRIALLAVPVIDAFHGTPYAMVNGSMWTILYEFRCYLLLIPLALLGMLRRPWVLAWLAAALLLVHAFAPWLAAPVERLPLHSVWFGQAFDATRLYGIFLAGAAFHAFGDRIHFTMPGLAGAAILLVAGFLIAPLAAPAFGLFGTYLVIGTALLGRGSWMERVNNRDDISYGVYLYGWPVTKLLVWYWPTIPLGMLMLLALAGALVCGFASWHLVEKPVLAWARSRTRPTAVPLFRRLRAGTGRGAPPAP